MQTYPIDRIVIGDRVRKDMGDLDALAASIRSVGLLHPVVIKPDGTLVAGHRRVEAVRRLGQAEIPVTVIDAHDLLRAERDENAARKDFTRTEAVAIARMIEEQERPLALERLREGGKKTQEIKHGEASGKLPEASRPRQQQVADVAAAAVDMCRHTYVRAKHVVDAAEADPEKFGDLPEKMDASGNVTGTYKELKRRQAGEPPAEKISAPPARKGFRNDKSVPYVANTPRKREICEAQKLRLIEGLSTINGHCRGLAALDLQMAFSVCSQEEIRTWSNKARDLSRTLRSLSASLSQGLSA